MRDTIASGLGACSSLTLCFCSSLGRGVDTELALQAGVLGIECCEFLDKTEHTESDSYSVSRVSSIVFYL